jgi:hypothetical protein
MSTQTSAQQQAARLRALADHLTVCPHLVPVVVHAQDLQIGHGGDRLTHLLDWIGSMSDVSLQMQVLMSGGELTAYVYADGWMGDYRDTVWGTVDGLAESLGIAEKQPLLRSIEVGDLLALLSPAAILRRAAEISRAAGRVDDAARFEMAVADHKDPDTDLLCPADSDCYAVRQARSVIRCGGGGASC